MAPRSLTLSARPVLTLLRVGAPTGAPAAAVPSSPAVLREVVPRGVYEADCAPAGWRHFYAVSSTGAVVATMDLVADVTADCSAVAHFLAAQLRRMEYGGPHR